jgi:DNA-binding NarL/FixJ family response regulator
MGPRRIILADVPRFLREMLRRALAHAPGLWVVGEIADLGRLSSAIEQTGAQWVIVSLPQDGKMPEATESLLAVHPSVRFLAVTTDGSQIKLKWTESHEQTLDDLSLDELIELLREDHLGNVRMQVDVIKRNGRGPA